ncbi:MAG: hypothetical protein ACI30I_06170, partial [Parabacteroides sp.]
HPYFSSAYQGARDAVFEKVEMSKIRLEEKEIREWAKYNLTGKIFQNKREGFNIEFKMRGIKEMLNQPHKHISEKNRSLKDMERLIYEAEHVLYIDDNKGNTMVKGYHYFKIIIAEEPSYLVVREMEDGSYYAYSIVDRLKRER